MDKHDDCRERSAEQRDTKKQVLWKSLISHCHRKMKHATLWRHFSMWLFVFMSVCEYLIVHHDSVSCRGVKALEHTPVLTNCAVCESYLWLLCCSHQPWCIFEIEKKSFVYRVLFCTNLQGALPRYWNNKPNTRDQLLLHQRWTEIHRCARAGLSSCPCWRMGWQKFCWAPIIPGSQLMTLELI